MLSWVVCALSQWQEKNRTLQIVLQPLFKQGTLTELRLLDPSRHNLFISYRTQETKGAVSSFRVMELSNAVGSGSSAVHSVFQHCARFFPALCPEKGSSHGRGSQPGWQRGAAGTGVPSLPQSDGLVVHQQKSISSLLKCFSPLFYQSCVKRFSLTLGRCFVLFIHNSQKWRMYSYSEIKW